MRRTITRVLASAAVIAATAGMLVLVSPAPAQAANFPGWDALQYMLTIKGSQLQSTMGEVAQGTWTNQAARVAATSASQFSAQTIYGNIGAADVAEIIPIDEPLDPYPGSGQRRIKIGSNGRGITIPTFSATNLRKAVTGPVGGTVVGTAFMFRGDIANGLMSWTGLGGGDGQAAVCTDPVFGDGNFLNFLTGQDCQAWRLQQEWIENSTVSGGVAGGWTCGPGIGTGFVGKEFCVRLVGATYVDVSGNERVRYYFEMTVDGVDWATGYNGQGQPSHNAWFEYRNIADGQWKKTHTGGGLPERLFAQQLYTPLAPWPSATVLLINGAVNGGYSAHRMDQYRVINGGEPAVVQDLETDPDRYYECVVTATGGAVLRQNSATWRNSDENPGVEPSCAAVPEGQIPARVQIYEHAGEESWLIWDETPDQSALDFMTEHQSCLVERSCFLDLVRIADGLSCFGLGSACDGWMTSPTRDADYQCTYGGTAVAISECYAYAPTFNEQKRLAGNAYADPATGKEIIGGGVSRSIENAVMGRPLGDPAANRDCWGRTGWGELNPLEWIVMGGQCVLEWAFVPRPLVLQVQQYEIQQEWEGTGAGKLATAVGAWNITPTASGCAIPVTLPMPFIDEFSFNVLDACPGSLFAPLAEITRVMVNISFVVMLVMLIRRYMGGAVDLK